MRLDASPETALPVDQALHGAPALAAGAEAETGGRNRGCGSVAPRRAFDERWFRGTGGLGFGSRVALAERRWCNVAVTPRGRDQVFCIREPAEERHVQAERQRGSAAAAVYVQTNDAAENEVLAFERGAVGRLAPNPRRSATRRPVTLRRKRSTTQRRAEQGPFDSG